jgi:hypothetical protein
MKSLFDTKEVRSEYFLIPEQLEHRLFLLMNLVRQEQCIDAHLDIHSAGGIALVVRQMLDHSTVRALEQLS